ncbi:unnamed protein product [Symbiodinium natans]|uniref:Uncharacterized protein n=1 Tax=Symbiodinium natans TaxID=878477 RepID=A0A812GLF6_9DINO|nr:unnamed protein product [Symbiodinium natans]
MCDAAPQPADPNGGKKQRWRRDQKPAAPRQPPAKGYADVGARSKLPSPSVPVPLSDEQVQQFIVEGFLELPPEDDGELHDSIFKQAVAFGRRAEELGNNVLPAIPDLVHVYESPRVRGAIESLLGPCYLLHPHRYCHTSERPAPQTWHRDSFWGHWHPRNACMYWIMALYFPQDTPLELGPTEIMPRSQWYNKDEKSDRGPYYGCARFNDREAESGVPAVNWHVHARPLCCSAGTVVLMHYDLWHRGGANISDGIRYMFKFQFSRMLSPALAPRLRSAPGEAIVWEKFFQEDVDAPARMQPVWQGVWDWLHGASEVPSQEDAEDAKVLLSDLLEGHGQDAFDPVRVAAAWKLARLCRARPPMLSKVLAALDQLLHLRGRNVMHVLDMLGPVAVPLLLEKPAVRQSADAVHGLGRCLDLADLDGGEAGAKALQALEEVLKGAKDPLVRICAAEALGCLRLQDTAWPLQQAVAEDTVGAVRATALHALIRLLTSGSLVEDSCLQALRATAQAVKPKDPDRYVRAYAAELCHRIDIVQQLAWDAPGANAAAMVESNRNAHIPPLVRWCTCGDGWHP